MSRINEKKQRLISEFQNLGWEDRYQLLIKKGKALDALPDDEKTDDLKVKGCQSQVWLKARLNDKGEVEFRGDSDALIVRGLVAILLEVYSGEKPQVILETEPDFVKEIGLDTHLSPSRANGLFSMIKQIKYYAMAFQALESQRQGSRT